MTDREDRAQSLFLHALEIHSKDEREAYLAGQCGAAADLRKEVLELLDHARRLGSFLDPVDGINGDDALQIIEEPGAVIGPYKLLEQIGEGGCGVVFLADAGGRDQQDLHGRTDIVARSFVRRLRYAAPRPTAGLAG